MGNVSFPNTSARLTCVRDENQTHCGGHIFLIISMSSPTAQFYFLVSNGPLSVTITITINNSITIINVYTYATWHGRYIIPGNYYYTVLMTEHVVTRINRGRPGQVYDDGVIIILRVGVPVRFPGQENAHE